MSIEMSMEVEYTSHRGERSWREIVPKRVLFGTNQHHITPQWLLIAYDVKTQMEWAFAMANLHAYKYGGKVLTAPTDDHDWKPVLVEYYDMDDDWVCQGCGVHIPRERKYEMGGSRKESQGEFQARLKNGWQWPLPWPQTSPFCSGVKT